MSNIDWDKAPAWANAVVMSPCRNEYFVEAWGVNSKRQPIGDDKPDNVGADMTSDTHAWRLVEERPGLWTGEGLPPVGADVECTFAVEMHEIWHRGTVVYCATSPEGDQFVVVDTGEVSACYRVDGTCLRPYRTPEQIAADERLHSVRNACSAIADTLDGLRGKTKVERAALAVVEAMIDAGYTRAEQ